MPIQLIIFLTKTKIFASEINNNGQADAISINGNPEIKCEGKESIDELIECLFDAFSIDGFGDEHFDIVIVDCGGDKTVIAYASEKCMGADKFSIIGVEKLLPLIVWNKTQLQAGEEAVAAFDEACYKIDCDQKNIVRCSGKARKGKESITLSLNDFSCLYDLNIANMQGGVIDTQALQERENTIARLEEEKNKLTCALNDKEKALSDALIAVKNAENKIVELNTEIENWKEKYPEPTNGAIQMLEIVRNYKKELENLPANGGIFGAILTNRNWEFSIKDTISKNKLNGSIAALGQLIGCSIDSNDFIALLTMPDAETKMILFTTKGIYFDNARTCINACWKLPEPGYLNWGSIDSFVSGGWDIYINVFGKPQMEFELAVGMENLCSKIAKMANELKDVDM